MTDRPPPDRAWAVPVLAGLVACSAPGPSTGPAAATRPEPEPTPAGPAGAPAEPSPAPRVAMLGRHDARDPTRIRYGWSGAGFSVRFRGDAVRARLDDAAGYHTVVVDGQPTAVLQTQPGPRTYVLAEGLPPGEHVVELQRRTEGSLGVTVLLDVEVDGEILPPRPPRYRIEAVGDSITCGYGNEGHDERCGFSAETENHYLTYAAVAAREVGAQLTTVAWSGKGIVFNYGDDAVEPMPVLYRRTIPTEPEQVASNDPPADVVLVNLGTNDYSTDGDPAPAAFAEAYADLLTAIRARHPDAVILCTLAPLLGPPDYATAIAGIDAAIAERAATGDTDIRRIDLVVEPIGFGCDWHPSVATHRAMADRLVPILTETLEDAG